jgi:hypothetical protein
LIAQRLDWTPHDMLHHTSRTRTNWLVALVTLVATCSWLASVVLWGQQLPTHPSLLRNHPKINYAGPSDDPVARLADRVRRGDTSLTFDEKGGGYLRAVLAALDVPVESQVLVFSKTSFQGPRISPTNPRALYFNDTASIGWVRGSDLLELVAQDPTQGAKFYTLRQSSQGSPQFERNDGCVVCHAFEATNYVPGMFIGSVFPGPDGTPLYGPTFTSDHRSLFEWRWGGWYVTGKHQGPRHLGNAVATDTNDLLAMVTPASVQAETLDGRFDPAGYQLPSSDIVALLVLEHQTRMLNLITRVGWEARIGVEIGRPLAAATEELVDYLLFVDEAPLPGPVRGPTTFAAQFASRGPKDRAGRSLRDLDLETRLLKFPCSYLIYSEPFEALPAEAKAAVYARLWMVLSGKDPAPRYARLTASDREALLEILRDTKPDLPPYFASANEGRSR